MAICNQIQNETLFQVALYDLVEGGLRALPEAHADLIMAAAFSRDGHTLATGGADERVVLWDVRRQTAHPARRDDLIAVTSLGFTPDSQTVFASSFGQNIHSWNVQAPSSSSKTWPGHSAHVNRLAMAPDGRSFASAGGDGTARFWSLPTADFASAPPPCEEFTTLFPPGGIPARGGERLAIFGLAVSPTQDRVAATEYRQLLLCDPRTATILAQVSVTNVFTSGKPAFARLAFSPDGRELAVGTDDGRVAFLDAATLQPVRTPVHLHKKQISYIAYALNGTVLATGGGFGTGIKLTDVPSGRLITNFSGMVGSFPHQPLAVSPDGRRLATGSPEGWVLVWDLSARRVVARSPRKVRFLIDVAFAPHGKLLGFADERGAIYLWDLTAQKPLRTLLGHVGDVNVLAFSPDGHTLASGGMDHTIRLWHPDIDQEVAILKGHSEWIWCIGFAEHGNALLSGSRDGTLKLWRALSFEQIQAQPAVQARGQ